MGEEKKIEDVCFPSYRRGLVPDENMVLITWNDNSSETFPIGELPMDLLVGCRQFLIQEDRADSLVFRRLRREFFVRDGNDSDVK